ncbi:MAG: hypothetical protein ACE5H2_02595 [Terriglobia bacterium]
MGGESTFAPLEVALLVAVAIAVLGAVVFVSRKKWAGQRKGGNVACVGAEVRPTPAPPVVREPDALYQRDRVVARVLGAEVDEASQEVRLGEIYNSDDLLIPDACEFQKYSIQIRKMDYASKIDKAAPHKGRVLRGVTADILGYREQ